MKLNNIAHNSLVFLTYLVIAILLTYPLIFNLGSFITYLKDSLFIVWILGWDIHSFLTLNFTYIFDGNIFYPYQNTLAYSENMFSTSLFGLPLYLVTKNIMITYNVIFILSFAISGLAAYFFIQELIHSRKGAFLGGYIFAFNPWRFGTHYHLHTLTAWWIPLCFWALIKYHRFKSVRYLLLLMLFLILNSLSSAYYMLFTFIAILIFEGSLFLFGGIKNMGERFKAIRWRHVAAFILIVIPAVLSMYIPYFTVQESMGFERTINANIEFSASPESYLKPPGNNLIWGRILGLETPVPKEGIKIIYIGMMPLILAFYSIVTIKRGMKSDVFKFAASFAVMGLCSFIFTFGPVIELFGRSIKNIAFYLLWFLPGFHGTRVPARFAPFVYLVLAIFVSIGISALEKKWVGIKKIVLFTVMIGMMVEIISFPLDYYRVPNNGKYPPVYKWLVRQPKGAVMEIPLGCLDALEGIGCDVRYLDAEYEYYSTFHWFPIMNGYSSYSPPIHKYASNVNIPEQLVVAKATGIKYVIVHKRFFAREILAKLPQVMSQNQLKLIYNNCGVFVFEN